MHNVGYNDHVTFVNQSQHIIVSKLGSPHLYRDSISSFFLLIVSLANRQFLYSFYVKFFLE